MEAFELGKLIVQFTRNYGMCSLLVNKANGVRSYIRTPSLSTWIEDSIQVLYPGAYSFSLYGTASFKVTNRTNLTEAIPKVIISKVIFLI